MKKCLITAAVMLAAAPLTLHAEAADPNLNQARTLVKQFAGQLQAEVAAGMKAGGPGAYDRGLLRQGAGNRRPDNRVLRLAGGSHQPQAAQSRGTPDAWELQVLEQFEARKAAGEPVDKLEFAEVVGSGDDQQYRYMKAIPTGQVCLNCHAAEIKPPVEEKLSQIYPQDQARGFSLGDIRGAFTLSKAN